MGRKKKKPIKPWCWYCNREFDDDKILAQHQRAKHFKCPFCHKKLYSGPGLTVHCIQVHKEKLDKVPEALPNRNSVDIDIYGMQGVPEEDIREHERIKRGDDGPSKPREDKSQQNSTQHSKHKYQNPTNPPVSMHTSMFPGPMGMGPMPVPGFPPMLPTGMPIPPPGFPLAPPGFPPMLPTAMQPGLAPNYPYNLLPPPPTSLAGVPPPPMGFPQVPPPPPPPTSESDTSFTSGIPPLLPPLSGVGPMIGIPPPSMTTSLLRPPGRLLPLPKVDTEPKPEQSKSQPQTSDRSQSGLTQSTREPIISSSTTETKTTIAKQAVMNNNPASATASSNKVSDNFIDIPSSNARIMHPNSPLSLEELRLKLPKYKDILEKLEAVD